MRTPVSSLATTFAARKMALAFPASVSNPARLRMNMFISAPSLTLRPNASLEQTAQPFVGQRLKALEINRQRMNARPEWRRRRHRGAGAFATTPQCRASAGKAPVADHIGFDRRDLDLVVFADQLPLGVETQTDRRTARKLSARDHELHPVRPPAHGCGVHARVWLRQASSSRVSPSCPSMAASTTCANPCRAAGACSTNSINCSLLSRCKSPRPCPHGFESSSLAARGWVITGEVY